VDEALGYTTENELAPCSEMDAGSNIKINLVFQPAACGGRHVPTPRNLPAFKAEARLFPIFSSLSSSRFRDVRLFLEYSLGANSLDHT
jgi:hypothetical protein